MPSPGCPPLTGSATADVCIVGGGFTGLWTALEITLHSPDTQVTLIESTTCGFGASGRNGGWATSWYDQLPGLIRRFGKQQGLWLADQSAEAVDALGDFLTQQAQEASFRRKGRIWAASSPEQQKRIMAAAAACRQAGRGDLLEQLDGADVAAATGYQGSSGGLLIRDSAAIQPAILVRLLREEALRRGVRIYESTEMVGLNRGRKPVVVTAAGQITATSVVLAINAWAAAIRELRRGIVAVASQVVLTEPLGDRIDSLEWSNGMLLGDARLYSHFAQVTADGRVAFGRRGGAFGRHGNLLPDHFYDPSAITEVAADFRRWFPQLADVPLTHAWSGPDDHTPGQLPFVGSLSEHGNIHYGVGYSGNGVAPSALVGRILGRLALGIDDEYTRCGLVSGPPRSLAPEPLRRLGSGLLRQAVERVESREEEGIASGRLGRAARRLSTFSTPRLRR